MAMAAYGKKLRKTMKSDICTRDPINHLIFSQQYDFTNAFAIEELDIGPESIKNNAFVLDLGIKYYFRKNNP